MNRYENIEVKRRFDGKRVFKTTYYPIIHPSDNDVIVISNDTTFLDSLAFKYYGDPTLYWIIAQANNLGKGRMSVPQGLSLRIPTNINNIIDKFNRLNL